MTENARLLLHPADSLLLPIDPSDVYYLEASGGETLIRIRRSRPLKDVRSLGKLFPIFQRHGFLRVHRNHAVNLARIRQIRRRMGSLDWELKLQPPVNRILPISRNASPNSSRRFAEHDRCMDALPVVTETLVGIASIVSVSHFADALGVSADYVLGRVKKPAGGDLEAADPEIAVLFRRFQRMSEETREQMRANSEPVPPSGDLGRDSRWVFSDNLGIEMSY